VRVIEHDPYRYGLELDEVERRRKLVEEVGAEIESMREELQKTVTTTAATTTSGGAAALPNPSDFDGLLSPDPEAGGGGGGGRDQGDDYYSAYEQQRQVELMQTQDEQLDGVFRTVGSLRQQADVMGRELEEQTGMLEEVDTLADRVGGKLSNGVKRIRHIVRKNEGKQDYKIKASDFFGLLTKRCGIRYDVIFLHRRPHLRPGPAINPGDCSIMYKRETLF
jgi:t-SNARE syntaxin family protein